MLGVMICGRLKRLRVGARWWTLLLTATVGVLLGGTLQGCGEEASPTLPARCESDETGQVVRLHASNLSCAEASTALYVLLPGVKRMQSVEIAGDKWSCINQPADSRPAEVRCSRGDRYFIIEDGSR